MTMTRHLISRAAIVAAFAGVVGCGSSQAAPGTHTAATAAQPAVAGINPRDFVARVDNPYFPLRPGTTFRYRGSKDGKPAIDVYTVTRATKRIAGVPCVTVHDNLFLAGRLAEQTVDWYTQDRRGDVWYFGEATRELDARGRTISTQGSWRTGTRGARPGIFMPAHPRVGASYRQEFLKGQAEDHFSVADLHASVTVAAGSYRNALRTREWTPLEPGVLDAKYYVRGVGEVKEVTVRGPRELLELVSITHR